MSKLAEEIAKIFEENFEERLQSYIVGKPDAKIIKAGDLALIDQKLSWVRDVVGRFAEQYDLETPPSFPKEETGAIHLAENCKLATQLYEKLKVE